MTVDYSIWSFAYTHSALPHDFFGGTIQHSNQGIAQVPMVYSALLGGPTGEPPRPIVIDTGMTGEWSSAGVQYRNVETPAQVLAKVGLAPEAVETVILTHLHFDHAGNMRAFPNARFYLQRLEYEGWREQLRINLEHAGFDAGWRLGSLRPDDIGVLEGLIAEGRVEILDGDREIAPGVTCRLAARTHTFGSQWVEVHTQAGPYVIAGDCVYWYCNVEDMWPPGFVQGDSWKVLDCYRAILDVVGGEVDRIVPGHDPELFTRHPSWVAGLNEMAEINVAAAIGSKRP
ncbi:MAG: N-acyl homoserine lactonase family protein [Alphaproteobacteria bacterium]|nr:N-acyl homoserine lactonase family protein [Alphaproteobacteria bacterium]MDP6567874.1 N-acyl homoserine lactonase family protein [Alphaproteobacteria bacterium]MDP6813120.1 N-acyl homoserine lactonase family protein [Alphaproteobacteria bacterium]